MSRYSSPASVSGTPATSPEPAATPSSSASTNRDFSTMIPKVVRWLNVDFSSLHAPRIDYESQTEISQHRWPRAGRAVRCRGRGIAVDGHHRLGAAVRSIRRRARDPRHAADRGRRGRRGLDHDSARSPAHRPGRGGDRLAAGLARQGDRARRAPRDR